MGLHSPNGNDAMRRPRTLPFVLALLSLAFVIVAVVVMANRIVNYNKAQGRTTYVQFEVNDRDFLYAGRPVSIQDLPPKGNADLGSIQVTFGDQSITLPVTIPPNDFADRFPGLERHSDWMRLVRFAELTGRDYEELMQALDAGSEDDRLVMVTKSIRPGVNPETWGKVWRKDWIFDFYEFLPEGSFRHERFAYPHSRSADQQEDLREAEAQGKGGIPELDTRSWQFQMAHLLMPEGSAPRIIAGDSPLVAVGWIFPASIFLVFVTTVCLLLAFAPESFPTAEDPTTPTNT